MDVSYEHRLTEVEDRSKSNQHPGAGRSVTK